MKRAKGHVTQWIRETLQPGQTAIMVGSAGNQEADAMRAAVGASGRVLSFDANEHGIAIAGSRGARMLYVDGEQSSLYRKNCRRGSPREVTAQTLDDQPDADLIVMDAQGAEVEILSGAPRQLTTCRHWILECWPKGLRGAGASAPLLWQRFCEAGYRVRWNEGDEVTFDGIGEWQATGATYVNWRADR